MKKILITTAICLIGAASMMAQGRINFANTSATGIRITDGGANNFLLGTASTAVFGIGPASVRVQLFAGLTSASLSPVLIGTGANLTSVTNSGSSAALPQGTFPGGGNLPLAGYDGSAPVFLQMTIESINGLYSGISPIIQVNLATGTALAPFMFSSVAIESTSQWTASSQWVGNLGIGNNIVVVPEPTSMVLAGLGAASLLIFRRRK